MPISALHRLLLSAKWANIEDVRRKSLTTRYCLVAILACISFFVTYAMKGFMELALGILPILLIITVALYLNHRNKNNLANHLLLLVANISLLILAIILGKSSGSQYLYFPVAFAGLTLFPAADRKTMLFYMLLSAICFLVIALIPDGDAITELPEQMLRIQYTITLLLALGATLSIGYNMISVNSEITNSLRTSQGQHQALLDGIPDQILRFDIEGTCLDFRNSKHLESQIESEPLRYIGQPISRLMAPKLSIKLRESAKETLGSGRPSSFEWVTGSVTGRISCQEFRISKLNNKEVICLIRDISDKHAQEVHKKAKEAAEHTAKVKSEFLSSMSHEIRTPMNIIMGLSKLLLKEKSLTPMVRENVDAIRFSAENLLAIVNDILDLSKIEAGKLTVTHSPLDVRDLLRKHVNFIKVYAGEKKLEVQATIDEDIPPHLVGDPVRLNQVFMNLTGNAIKFTKKGRITVKAELIRKEGNKAIIRFSVCDTGVGIPAEKIHYIFEQFSQLQAGEETISKGGTGLGLTISQKLVNLMGGKIEVESVIGLGSTFSFELPFTIAKDTVIASTAELVHKSTSIPDLSGVHILMAEDNSMNQFYARQLLSSWNIKLDIASNGQEVVEKAKDHKYDIILMDLQMPLMDGLEALKKIRTANNINQRTPVVCVSADAFEETRINAMQHGMDDYLTKPINEDALFEILVRHTGRKQLVKAGIKKQEVVKVQPLLDLESLSPVLLEDKEALNEFLELFVRSVREDLDKLSSAVIMLDLAAIGKLAHKLKSSFRNVGAMPSAKLLEEMESMATGAGNGEQGFAEVLRELLQHYQSISLSIRQKLSSTAKSTY